MNASEKKPLMLAVWVLALVTVLATFLLIGSLVL